MPINHNNMSKKLGCGLVVGVLHVIMDDCLRGCDVGCFFRRVSLTVSVGLSGS